MIVCGVLCCCCCGGGGGGGGGGSGGFVCMCVGGRRGGVLLFVLSRPVLCIPYNHAPCHFMQSHIRKAHACLAVTCHLHFWQNDLDLLSANAVTRGWNEYRNKSQLRYQTL